MLALRVCVAEFQPNTVLLKSWWTKKKGLLARTKWIVIAIIAPINWLKFVCKITCCEIQRMPGTAIKGKKQTLIVNPFTGTCQKNIPPPHTHAHTHTLLIHTSQLLPVLSVVGVWSVCVCVPRTPSVLNKGILSLTSQKVTTGGHFINFVAVQ